LLGLFQTLQIGIQIFFFGPAGAIDALQHLVVRIATPIGTGHFHQLENLELGGVRHMRAAAQIDEIAFTVKRDRSSPSGICWMISDLVFFAQPVKEPHGFGRVTFSER
jgi:hypothetical protein